MQSLISVVDRTDVPTDRPQETIDIRSLGPPEPLKDTLETRAELPSETVLAQRNDRVPQFLFPKLDDCGYVIDTRQVCGFDPERVPPKSSTGRADLYESLTGWRGESPRL